MHFSNSPLVMLLTRQVPEVLLEDMGASEPQGNSVIMLKDKQQNQPSYGRQHVYGENSF